MIPKTVKQMGILAASKVLTRVMSFVAFIYVARTVGPSHFGAYTYLISLVSLFLGFAGLGILGEVIRKGRKSGKVAIENSFYVYILATTLWSLVVFALVKYRGYSTALAVLAGGFLVFRAIYDFMNIFHFIEGRIRYATLGTIGERLIFTLLVFALPPKTSSLFIASLVSLMGSGLYMFKGIRFKPKKVINFSYISMPFLLSSVFIGLGERLPVIIYDVRFGVTTLGIFGAALTIYHASSLMFNEAFRFIQVRTGFMTKEADSKFKRGIVILSFLLLASFIVFRPLMGFLMEFTYGNTYLGVGEVFSNLMLALPAAVLIFYPRAKLVYSSPKRYALAFGFHALLSLGVALVAVDIASAAFMYSMSYWLSAALWWVLITKIRTPTPSTSLGS